LILEIGFLKDKTLHPYEDGILVNQEMNISRLSISLSVPVLVVQLLGIGIVALLGLRAI